MAGQRIFSVIGGGGGSVPVDTLTGRAGVEAIPLSAQSISVVFSSGIGSTDYALTFSIHNYVDADPIFLEVVGVVKLSTGFDVTFNAPADTADYQLNWIAVRNL